MYRITKMVYSTLLYYVITLVAKVFFPTNIGQLHVSVLVARGLEIT